MRGVADKHDAAAMPLLDRDPVDRSAMDLFVARECGEIVLDYTGETGEAMAQAVEPARQRLIGARLGNVAKAIGSPVADRAEPKEAALAQVKLKVGEAAGPDRRDAAPGHGAGVGGWRRAQSEGADGGRDPVRAHDQVVVAGRAVAEGDRNVIVVLGQGPDRRTQATAHALDAGDQHLLQARALDADKGADIAPERRKIALRQYLASLVAELPAAEARPGLLHRSV